MTALYSSYRSIVAIEVCSQSSITISAQSLDVILALYLTTVVMVEKFFVNLQHLPKSNTALLQNKNKYLT